jgi:D-glycero-alpha-D-manno-heptose-7-phosphate kinase
LSLSKGYGRKRGWQKAGSLICQDRLNELSELDLIKALHAYKNEYPWPNEIAEETCYVEQQLLHESSGKQDAYAASLGGLLWLEISTGGGVSASRLVLRRDFINELKDHLVFANTGTARNSSDMQNLHRHELEKGNMIVEESLKEIEKIAVKIKQALLEEDVASFGKLMGDHWEIKSRMNSAIADNRIRSLYRTALRNGAIGGNLMGAGGGGHFMFVCRNRDAKRNLSSVLVRMGLQLIDLGFELRGSAVTNEL